MSRSLFIAEKPSVAREFAKALSEPFKDRGGYMESDSYVVTWCYGHLVTMSYPEAYDKKYKKWRLSDLPFMPEEFKYEIIGSAKRQFDTVSGLLKRQDVGVIYVCTDSGREGEYIYRLVDQMAGVGDKAKKRVWIDSQTREEIHRGIEQAKDLSEYDNLAASAYLRAKEDYLMGINFSRLLTLKYGAAIASLLGRKFVSVSAGRVMTCVLGMAVRREREIRSFVKTPYYRLIITMDTPAGEAEGEWRAVEGSEYFMSPYLYKDNGFKNADDAKRLMLRLEGLSPLQCAVSKTEKKTEKKNPPLLYNLAELQNDCSGFFKISPAETLDIVQELYEKKLVTYPRTDARVLSSAAAKEIDKNIQGLAGIPSIRPFADEILSSGSYKDIAKTRYVNDKMITDHYAMIPTGQGIGMIKGLKSMSVRVYELIVRRFIAIFYGPAVYRKITVISRMGGESFYTSERYLKDEGYLRVMKYSFRREKDRAAEGKSASGIEGLKKGDVLNVAKIRIKEGETTPPKRYSSGSMILAMENAGQLIEDEELRALIKGSGIGTSATRAEILKKLVNINYLELGKKTQIIKPSLLGELVYEAVLISIKPLLDPELTASWEKGLSMVAEGDISSDEYMKKLEDFISRRCRLVIGLDNQYLLRQSFGKISAYYRPQARQGIEPAK